MMKKEIYTELFPNLDLEPPWLEYPDEPKLSMFWRMSSGEDYMMTWGQWYSELSIEDQKKYQQKFPEPDEWKEFYGSDKNT